MKASAHIRIAEVLRRARDYDQLSAEEQALIRTHWAERMTALTTALRLDQKYAAQGRPYVELDDDGNVVRREPAATE